MGHYIDQRLGVKSLRKGVILFTFAADGILALQNINTLFDSQLEAIEHVSEFLSEVDTIFVVESAIPEVVVVLT